MKLQSMTLAVVFLCLSLAVCVLGRPQPSSLTGTSLPQHSAMEVLEVSHAAEKSPSQYSTLLSGLFPHLHFPTLEIPFKQERRSLKGSGGRGVRSGGVTVGAGGGGGGSGGGMSAKVAIIVIASTVGFLLLVGAVLVWCKLKTRKNPNWRFQDCFRRKKPPTEKLFTSVKSDVDPDAAEHKMAVDVPRMDHAAKSRKQASLSHDFKTTSSSN